MMTFRQLRDQINNLPEEWLDCNVSIYIPWEDQYYNANTELWFADEDNDILDKGHPVICIWEEPTNTNYNDCPGDIQARDSF